MGLYIVLNFANINNFHLAITSDLLQFHLYFSYDIDLKRLRVTMLSLFSNFQPRSITLFRFVFVVHYSSLSWCCLLCLSKYKYMFYNADNMCMHSLMFDCVGHVLSSSRRFSSGFMFPSVAPLRAVSLYSSSPSLSISSSRKSMSGCVVAPLDTIMRKKLGLSPSGWYPTMVLPFSIIIALIFGATWLNKPTPPYITLPLPL